MSISTPVRSALLSPNSALPLTVASLLAIRAERERRDPVRLAVRAGMDPDPWQAGVLRSESPRILLNCSRQSGKSTVTSVLALHTAIYEPESLVLLISRSARQAGELFRKCLATYHRVAGTVPAPLSEGALHLELDNGSRIIGLPGKEETLRSFSGVRLICIDEAARVADALYKSVRPMLAVSGGRVIALSTPWGKQGWWYEAWQATDQTWERYCVPATECPRISPAFLAEEQAVLGPIFYQQEYMCAFTESMESLFARAVIDAALDDSPPLWAAS